MKVEPLHFDICIAQAAAIHGDVCAGLTLGTRMAIAGLKAIGIKDPKGKDRKNVLVFVEIDRCATDAIMAITGCQPGKRTMKILDYGKMAATFFNLSTRRAVRVTVRELDGGSVGNDAESRMNLYGTLPDADLLHLERIELDVQPQDMPGPPVRVVKCELCGERIMDMREEIKDGKTMCRPCAVGSSYYSVK